jgi:hypothetical protein
MIRCPQRIELRLTDLLGGSLAETGTVPQAPVVTIPAQWARAVRLICSH